MNGFLTKLKELKGFLSRLLFISRRYCKPSFNGPQFSFSNLYEKTACVCIHACGSFTFWEKWAHLFLYRILHLEIEFRPVDQYHSQAQRDQKVRKGQLVHRDNLFVLSLLTTALRFYYQDERDCILILLLLRSEDVNVLSLNLDLINVHSRPLPRRRSMPYRHLLFRADFFPFCLECVFLNIKAWACLFLLTHQFQKSPIYYLMTIYPSECYPRVRLS